MHTHRHPRATASLAAALLAIVAACSSAATAAPSTAPTAVVITPLPSPSPTPFVDWIGTVNPNPTDPPWFAVPLTDVNTGKSFTVADFKGKVVLVETMATWCPTCQGEMSQVQEVVRDLDPANFVAISLDVDPNEDANILKKYAAKNKFTTWRIAIAPIEIGRFLSMNYDEAFLNPPEQAMLFVDKKGGVWGLPLGIKSATSIKKTLAEYIAA
jgi:thiol-disulfide isomerase/thioredoxin